MSFNWHLEIILVALGFKSIEIFILFKGVSSHSEQLHLRNMPFEMKDKNGEPIKVGDKVYTRVCGSKYEGEVEKIVTTDKEAKEEQVKHLPKVEWYSPTRPRKTVPQ